MKRTRNRNRSILNHGTGKGDKDRTTNPAAFNANLEGIKFSGVPATEDLTFRKTGQGRAVKSYGSAHSPTVFARLTSHPIIH